MEKISVGIDVGTYHVKVVIAERSDDPRQPPHILGTGYAESRGMRHGYILSTSEVTRGIRAAAQQASGSARYKITKAYIGIGGEGLDESTSRGEAVVERGDSTISERDAQRALEASEQALPPAATQNRRIIHRIPITWSVDGTKVLGKNPIGMKGMRIAVEALFITFPTRHLEDLSETVEAAGIEVEDIVASPLAAGLVALSKPQKRVGCVLANIGAETTSIAVFEEDIPISMKVFPVGASDIASDLALGLKIPLEEAEQLKMGAVTGATYPKKKVDDIINKRTLSLSKSIDDHLRKIGRDALLPAGLILTGGGSGITNMAEVAQTVVRLPCRLAAITAGDVAKTKLRDNSWSVAYGLTVWGLMSRNDLDMYDEGSMRETLHSIASSVLKFFKKFLP